MSQAYPNHPYSQQQAQQQQVAMPTRAGNPPFGKNKKNGAIYPWSAYFEKLDYMEPYYGNPAAATPIPPAQALTDPTIPINQPQRPSQAFEATQPATFEAGDFRPELEGGYVPQEVHAWDVPGYWQTPVGMANLQAAISYVMASTQPQNIGYAADAAPPPSPEPVAIQRPTLVPQPTPPTPQGLPARRRPPTNARPAAALGDTSRPE